MRAAIYALAAALALAPSPVRADTVCEWMEFAERIVAAGAPAPGTPRMPDHDRAQTQVALAMFEALNAIGRRYQSYLNLPAGESSASPDAAAVAAAYRVLLARYPGQRTSLDEGYNLAMNGVVDPAARHAGQAIPLDPEQRRAGPAELGRLGARSLLLAHLGGVHYRFSNEAGEEVGHRVARMALGNVMRSLPVQGWRRTR